MPARDRLPADFNNQITGLLSADSQSFFDALETPPVVSVRLNPSKRIPPPSEDRVPWCSEGYYLKERPSFTLDPLFHAGCYYVQDASSMFLEQAFLQTADLSRPLKVLDLCGAPGGKTTHLLSLLPPGSTLVSNEVIRSRVPVLGMNTEKWGNANVLVSASDASAFGSLKNYFDVIVTDVPCSGEGLFRKDPDAVNEWSKENVSLCSARQRRILEDIWPALKENGILIYSTCTFNTEENEDNLSRFLQQHEGESVPLKVPGESGIVCSEDRGIKGYRFYPHKVKGEGFFLSVVRKTGGGEYQPLPKRGKYQQQYLKNEKIASVLTGADRFVITEKNQTFLALPRETAEVRETIASCVHLVHSGIAVGELKHDKLIPAHALALSIDLNKERFNCIELSLEDALRFMRKEPLTPSGQGITLFMYKGFGLGWGNVLPGRVNNLLPGNFQIRIKG